MSKLTIAFCLVCLPIAAATVSDCHKPEAAGVGAARSSSGVRASPSASVAPAGCHISGPSRAVISKLGRPMHAKLFTTPQKPIPYYGQLGDLEAYAATVRAVKEILDGLTHGSDGRFDYEVVEVDAHNPPQEAKAALMPGPTHQMGILFSCGDLDSSIPINWLVSDSIPGGLGLEFRLLDAIRILATRVEGRTLHVGVLTGHGEARLSDPNFMIGVDVSLQGALAKTETDRYRLPKHELHAVDLQGGDQPIDPQLEGLLIIQPESSLTDKELRRIDEFVMRGKKLMVAASAVNIKPRDRTMQASLDSHGLGPLLLGYGFQMREDVVLDRLEYADVAPRRCDYNPMLILPLCPSETFPEGAHLGCDFAPLFLGVPEIAMASSLVLRAEQQPEEAPNLRAIIATSPKGQRRTGAPLLNPLQEWTKAGTEERLVVAATISGRLRSAFTAGAERPRVPDGKTASVFVVSSASLFANPYVRAMGQAKALSPQLNRPVVDSGMSLECAGDSFAGRFEDAFFVLRMTLDWMDITPEFARLSEQTWCGETLPPESAHHQ